MRRDYNSYFEEANYPDGYRYDEVRSSINQKYYALARRGLARRGSTNGNRVRVLDVGCGFGYFLKTCDENGWETYGLDILKYAVSNAKRFTQAKLICQSADDPLPFPDDFFNVVTAFNLIEHLEKPLDLLTEVRRVLKKGGLHLLETPNMQGVGRIILQRNWTGFLDKTHTCLFSPSELKGLIEKAGFAEVKLETRGLPYHPKMRPSTTSIKNNFVVAIAMIYKFFSLPLGLGDHIFAYCYG